TKPKPRRLRRSRDMAGNPQGIRSLARYSKLPIERIRYVPDADAATVRSIHRGILFLMAFWSVYSVQAFGKLTDVLARLDTDDLELVVVDVDGSLPLDVIPEFRGWLYHGNGETAWVRDGQIVAMSGPGVNTACFKPNTLALLSMP